MRLRTETPTTRYTISCCPTCERPWLASRIPQKVLDDLARHHRVVDFVKSDGVVDLRKEGDLFIGSCPFHRGAVLVIEEQGTRFSCSGGCPKGGSSVEWLMKTTGFDQHRTVECMLRAVASYRKEVAAAERRERRRLRQSQS